MRTPGPPKANSRPAQSKLLARLKQTPSLHHAHSPFAPCSRPARVKAMNLVVLCPDYDDYRVAPVPVMDDVIAQIVRLCHTHQLGFRLL